MTTRIDVELDDQEVRQRLAVLMRSVTDTLPVMRGIAAELLA
ncbi:TPA: phage virion morphogenesis protein, partial [Pseudomonas aeruginosa]|nr:phage virion morphogenesis protein [Pseudomonas aeruginosa]